jgi:hypothetical protein
MKRGGMRGTLLYSLLELAPATSQNLLFAHWDDVYASHGEETITCDDRPALLYGVRRPTANLS